MKVPLVFRALALALLLLLVSARQGLAQQPPAGPQPSPTPQEGRVEGPPPGFDRPIADPNARPRSLTAAEAVRLALTQASAYTQAQFEERIAAEDLRQARAAFLPTIALPLSYAGTSPSRVRAPGEPLTYSYASSSAINETAALLSASGELDISGRLRANMGRSRNLLAAARAGSEAARRALVLDTLDAYYALVLARQKRRLAEETLSLAEGFVKVTEGFAERGEDESGGADLLRARAGASARRNELEQARVDELASMNVLRALTGVGFNTPIDVSRIAQDIPASADLTGFAEEQVRRRPELSQIDFQRRAAVDEASAERRWRRVPQLSYSLNGGFDAADFRPLKRYAGGSVVFTLNVPVFDFGASRSREAQARLRARALDAQREATLNMLRQQFHTARAAALTALIRIKETESGAALAQQNLTLIFARYRAKKATITDVVDAQSAYADARLSYFQAIIDYRTARARLEQNIGQ